MQKTIKTADIFHAISDQGSLQIFNFIATEKKKKINSQTLQALNGLTRKQVLFKDA